MKESLFLFDFGTLPKEFLMRKRLTNVTELLWSEEIEGVLRLCGTEDAKIGDGSSDFEKFEALCSAMPLLLGHPIQGRIQAFLKAFFNVEEPLTPASCKRVWKQVADALLFEDASPADFLPVEGGACLLRDAEWLPMLPSHILPVLDVRCLSDSSAATLADWESEIDRMLAAFLEAGAQTVFFFLHSDFHFFAPNPYAVEKALASRKKNAEQRSLITAQLLRELCVRAKTNSLHICLRVAGDGREAVSLLEYVARTVGVPTVSASAATQEAMKSLISYAACARAPSISFLLDLSDLPSNPEFSNTLSALAARYPVERLTLATHTDLRFMTFAQETALQWRKQWSSTFSML